MTSASIPIGTVMMWAGGTDASTVVTLLYSGWLVCDGSAYDTGQQKDLFQVLGEAYGGGNGTFCVPSYKGLFLRGVTGTTQRDPDAASRTAPRTDQSNKGNTGNNVGSLQGFDIRSHTHTYQYNNDYHKSTHTLGHRCLSGQTTASMAGTGSGETRPVNQYVNFIIKANTLADTVPVGAVTPYAGSHVAAAKLASDGWLLCNGAKTSTSQYQSLQAVLASGYGAETGYYYLPDYRGRFLRGVQGEAIPGLKPADPDADSRTAPQPGLATPGHVGNLVGSLQGSEFQSHAHTYTYNNDYWSTAATAIGPDMRANDTQGATSDTTGGSETRPININVNYLVKCQ